jgi:hypothetical protein
MNRLSLYRALFLMLGFLLPSIAFAHGGGWVMLYGGYFIAISVFLFCLAIYIGLRLMNRIPFDPFICLVGGFCGGLPLALVTILIVYWNTSFEGWGIFAISAIVPIITMAVSLPIYRTIKSIFRRKAMSEISTDANDT